MEWWMGIGTLMAVAILALILTPLIFSVGQDKTPPFIPPDTLVEMRTLRELRESDNYRFQSAFVSADDGSIYVHYTPRGDGK